MHFLYMSAYKREYLRVFINEQHRQCMTREHQTLDMDKQSPLLPFSIPHEHIMAIEEIADIPMSTNGKDGCEKQSKGRMCNDIHNQRKICVRQTKTVQRNYQTALNE